MKITLNKALKLKNKMVSNISRLGARMQDVNSYVETNKPAYDAKEVLAEYNKAVEDLVQLKTTINAANSKIMSYIIRMSELKSTIKVLGGINTTSGDQRPHYAASGVSIRYIATIGEVERNQMIEQCQKELEDLQDQIDAHNAATEIEV